MTIQEELGRLRLEMRFLRQDNARKACSIEQAKAKNAKLEQARDRLRQQTKRLEAEIEELKNKLAACMAWKDKLVGMLFKKNAKVPSDQASVEKKTRGAQTGHIGHGKKNPLQIDEEKYVYLTHCPTCEHTLNESDAVYTRTVQDIPVQTAITTRYTIQRQWRTHCQKEVSAIPENTIPFVHIGLRALVLICLLRYRLRVPLAKIAEILLNHHGIRLTEGGIQSILHTLSRKFTHEYERILKEIRAAPLKHADETSWRILGTNGWHWLFATPKAALHTIEASRGKGVPDRILGPNPEGVLIRDDYASYEHLKTMEHQSCWAHLLRLCHEAVKQPTVSAEMRTLEEELTDMFVNLKRTLSSSFRMKRRQKAHTQYAKQLREIEARSYTHKDAKQIQTRMKHQGNNLITALLHENVPLTNNHAERQIRPMAVIRKISGGSRSTLGGVIQGVNMTIMQTIALRGQDYLTELQKLLTLPEQSMSLERGE